MGSVQTGMADIGTAFHLRDQWCLSDPRRVWLSHSKSEQYKSMFHENLFMGDKQALLFVLSILTTFTLPQSSVPLVYNVSVE